jgi:hypothetical protein
MSEIKISEMSEIKMSEIKMPEINMLLVKIMEVLKLRVINVFHVLVVAPMLAYIGYLAVNNKPISFGNGLIYLAIGMGLFHLSKIVVSFMNYSTTAVLSTEAKVTTSITTEASTLPPTPTVEATTTPPIVEATTLLPISEN